MGWCGSGAGGRGEGGCWSWVSTRVKWKTSGGKKISHKNSDGV